MSNNNVVEAIQCDDRPQIQAAINTGFNPNDTLIDGYNSLHFAVIQQKLEITELLLQHGAEPNRKVFMDKMAQKVEQPIIFDFPDQVDLYEDIRNLGDVSALHIATKRQNYDIMNLLLEYKADPNLLDLGGCSPLHWAVAQSDEDASALLLQYESNPNLQDIVGNTPLHEASRRGLLQIAELLLENQANPEIMDLFGNTPLKQASEHPMLLNILIRYSNIRPEGWVTH